MRYPLTKEALVKHVAKEGEVHLHRHSTGRQLGWRLTTYATKLCGTDSCQRFIFWEQK